MRLIVLLIAVILIGQNARAQDQEELKSDTTTTEHAELTKLEKKVKELEKELEDAMAYREELRKEADASSEPEAYSKVATQSVKITKLHEKLQYAQQKLMTSQQKEQKKKQKANKKKNST